MIKKIEGGITSPKGFLASGAHIGIKKAKKDLAIIYSETPAIYSGTFTTNIVKAACVTWNMKRLELEDLISAVVINSGNANACTGVLGDSHNEAMALTASQQFGVEAHNVLIASTGVIGKILDIEKVKTGIETVSKDVKNTTEAGHDAATAIMTTDTFSKEIALEFQIAGKTARMGGMAKGSGMIHPNMATMLSFITTDVAISRELLEKAVKQDIQDTYNMISVDGDTSTNDMVIVLANGHCGNCTITEENADYVTFQSALHQMNVFLSEQIIHDGEGVTKVITVKLEGAKSKEDARLIAKSVITSNLVKTAFFGQDANWGRILCAMGYSGGSFDPNKVDLFYESAKGKIKLMDNGLPEKFDEAFALEILKEKEITVLIHLSEGSGSATAWGCDLSYEYVRINGEYRS